MTQIDVIDALAHDDVEYEGEKNPGNEGVGVEAILVVFCDVTETEEVQLLQLSAACRIDREKDWPCHETADEADGRRNLEVSKQQEAIERVVVEDIAIWDLVESANPIEHTRGKSWRALPVKRASASWVCGWEEKGLMAYCGRSEPT